MNTETPERGRPSLYTPEIIDKAKQYLAECEDEEIDYESEYYQEPQGHGGSLRRSARPIIRVKMPTVGGLARYLGVARSTLYEWKETYPDFSDIMEALGAEQEDRLINNGLSGDYNSTISKVLLTKHGYREGIDNTSGDKPIKNVEVVIVPPNSPPDETPIQGDDSISEELRQPDQDNG